MALTTGNTHRFGQKGRAVGTVREFGRGLGELGKTRDREVLLVRVLLDEDLLRLLHGVEHVRLPVLIPVRADTEVDLARVLVRLERLGDTWWRELRSAVRLQAIIDA